MRFDKAQSKPHDAHIYMDTEYYKLGRFGYWFYWDGYEWIKSEKDWERFREILKEDLTKIYDGEAIQKYITNNHNLRRAIKIHASTVLDLYPLDIQCDAVYGSCHCGATHTTGETQHALREKYNIKIVIVGGTVGKYR